MAENKLCNKGAWQSFLQIYVQFLYSRIGNGNLCECVCSHMNLHISVFYAISRLIDFPFKMLLFRL